MRATSRSATSAAAALLLLALTTTAPQRFAHAASSSSSSKCYFPSGSESSDVPCDPAAQVSMCCGSRDACLSSGLCRNVGTGPSNGTSYARGTCTDQSWASPVCPPRCRINPDAAGNPSAYNFGTGGVQVWQCVGQGYANPGAYCCESRGEQTGCCRTQNAVFSLPGASVGNAAPAVQTPALPSEVAASTTASNSPKETSSTTQSHGSSSRDSTAVTATSGTTRDGTTATVTPGPTTVTAEADSGAGLGDGAKIGIGIGIGIGLAILTAVAVFTWYRMRTQGPPAATGAAAAPEARDYCLGLGRSELEGKGVLTELGPTYMERSAWGQTGFDAGRQHGPAELAEYGPAELDTGPYGRLSR